MPLYDCTREEKKARHCLEYLYKSSRSRHADHRMLTQWHLLPEDDRYLDQEYEEKENKPHSAQSSRRSSCTSSTHSSVLEMRVLYRAGKHMIRANEKGLLVLVLVTVVVLQPTNQYQYTIKPMHMLRQMQTYTHNTTQHLQPLTSYCRSMTIRSIRKRSLMQW